MPRALDPTVFSASERVVAAKELARDNPGHVSVNSGFLEALADDLLTMPLPEIQRLRAACASLLPVPAS